VGKFNPLAGDGAFQKAAKSPTGLGLVTFNRFWPAMPKNFQVYPQGQLFPSHDERRLFLANAKRSSTWGRFLANSKEVNRGATVGWIKSSRKMLASGLRGAFFP